MTDAREPTLGATADATVVVAADDLASTVAQREPDDFPPVFATARLVALMELAASRVLQPCLGDGELSVGTTIGIAHTAATAIGDTVVATATYTGRVGRQFAFDVVARDGGGEIGRGTHRRAIVATARLVAGARRRRDGAPG